VGEGFTVSADDGTAFEWRLGDQSLGLLQAEGGPVYTQSADLAAQRQPIAPPAPPVVETDPSISARHRPHSGPDGRYARSGQTAPDAAPACPAAGDASGCYDHACRTRRSAAARSRRWTPIRTRLLLPAQ
jgi:hypothetical protein